MSDLEQFCLLAKTQKGLACSALVQQVLSHKKIFTFGELLLISSIQALRDTEFDKYLTTLELFSYGTFSDYLDNRGRYLELNSFQTKKLKMLTLLSAARSNKSLNYPTLMNQLHLYSVREFEDLVIDAMHAGLVSGYLDQVKQIFFVLNSCARDVKLSEVVTLVDKLLFWKNKCDKAKNNLLFNNRIIEKSSLNAVQEQTDTQLMADQEKSKIKDSFEIGAEMGDFGGRRLEGGKGRSLKRSFLPKP